jgi:dihydroorotate dehydrogenase (NAD+) catalytic subunit
MSGRDAVEFMLAGASAVQVGTANFVYPDSAVRVLRDVERYLEEHGFAAARDLVGALQID